MATITPYLLYADVAAALGWLRDAVGFTEVLRYADDDGTVTHAEARLGDAVVYLGHPGPAYRPPAAVGVTVMLHVGVDDVDAHHARAAAAGAEVGDLEDTDYGDRRYRAVDPEGHEWFFASPVRDVAPQDWGAVAADG